MKKYLLLSVMLLTAALSACAKPQPAPSDEVLIANEESAVRKKVIEVIGNAPDIGFPGALALTSAAGGFPQLKMLTYSVCSAAAPCPVPPAAVAGQEGGEGHAAAGNSGSGAAQVAPAAGVDRSVLRLDGPRGPIDQHKAPLQLPGPVEPSSK